MAISPKGWANNWVILVERFHLDLSQPSENLWWQKLGRWMDDAEFAQVVQIIWESEDKFLPPPATFREIAKGLRERQTKAITAAAVEEKWGAPTQPPDWLRAWTALRSGFKRRWPTSNLALIPPNSDQGTPATLTLALANGDLHQFRQVDGCWRCDRSDLNQIAQEILSAATPARNLTDVIAGL